MNITDLLNSPTAVGLITLLITQIVVVALPFIHRWGDRKNRQEERMHAEQERIKAIYQRSLKYLNLLIVPFTGSSSDDYSMDFHIQMQDALADLHVHLISQFGADEVSSYENLVKALSRNSVSSISEVRDKVLDFLKRDSGLP